MPVANVDDLTGTGMPAQLAQELGGPVSKLTGVGTTQSGAAVVLSRNTELNPGGGTTAFVLPSSAKVMQSYMFNNQQSTTGTVFVPSGHTLNSVANASVTVAQFATAIVWQYKPKNWTFK